MPASRLTTFAAGAALATATLLSVPLNSVGSGQIKNNSVTSKDVKNGTLAGADVKLETLTGDQITDGSIKSNDLSADALPKPAQAAYTFSGYTSCDPSPCMLTTAGVYVAGFDVSTPEGSISTTVGDDDVDADGTLHYTATASLGTFASGTGVTCQLMDGAFNLSSQQYLKLPAGSRDQIVLSGMDTLTYGSGSHDVKLSCWSDSDSSISIHNASIQLTVTF